MDQTQLKNYLQRLENVFKECYDMTFPKHPNSFSRNTRYEKKIKPSIFDEIRYKIYSLKYRCLLPKEKIRTNAEIIR